MAKGDTKVDASNVANNQFLTVQPPSGEEWAILFLSYEGSVEFYYPCDGTVEVFYDSDTGRGYFVGRIPVTNAKYLKVKNVSGAAIDIGYGAYQTK